MACYMVRASKGAAAWRDGAAISITMAGHAVPKSFISGRPKSLEGVTERRDKLGSSNHFVFIFGAADSSSPWGGELPSQQHKQASNDDSRIEEGH